MGKLIPRLLQAGDETLTVLRCVISGETDPDRTINHFRLQSDGFQHMAAGAFLAGGTPGHIHTLCFHEVHQNFAPPAGKGDAENMGSITGEDHRFRHFLGQKP